MKNDSSKENLVHFTTVPKPKPNFGGNVPSSLYFEAEHEKLMLIAPRPMDL